MHIQEHVCEGVEWPFCQYRIFVEILKLLSFLRLSMDISPTLKDDRLNLRVNHGHSSKSLEFQLVKMVSQNSNVLLSSNQCRGIDKLMEGMKEKKKNSSICSHNALAVIICGFPNFFLKKKPLNIIFIIYLCICVPVYMYVYSRGLE